MATRQYNNTRRTQATGLADIIRTLISGTTNYQRRPQKVSEKTIENMEDLKQNFHPTNIGRALGRKTAGMFINMFKSDDKVGAKKGRTREIKENKKNNPLYTKVAEGADKPVRKNDTLSDVFSKIYNILKLNIEENRKQYQLDKNFAEEKEDERENRHKELVKAISGLTGGSMVTKVEEKKKENTFSNILDSVKKMIENFKKQLEPLLEFAKDIGKNGFKYLSKFLSLLGNPALLSFLLPVAAASALLWLIKNAREEIEANPYDPKFKNVPYAMQLRGEAKTSGEAAQRNIAEVKRQVGRTTVKQLVEANLPEAQYQRELGASKSELSNWLATTKDKPGASWQAPVRDASGQITTRAGPVGDDLRVSPAELSGLTPTTARTTSMAPGSTSSISPDYFKESPSTTPTMATPVPPAPNRSGRRIQAAIEEQFYQEEVKAAKRSITINSPKTVVTGDTKAQSIDIEESAPVRIDDPTLKHIQERNLRRF